MTAVIITAVVAIVIIICLFRWIAKKDKHINDIEAELKEEKESYVTLCEEDKRKEDHVNYLDAQIKICEAAKNDLNSGLLREIAKGAELNAKIEQLNKKAFAQGIQLNELRKEKKSLQNQIAVAWKQVQSHKVDENGVQRTLTGAIDAKLDELEKSLIEKNKAIEELQQSHKGLIVELNSQKVSQKKPIPARGGRTTKTTKK